MVVMVKKLIKLLKGYHNHFTEFYIDNVGFSPFGVFYIALFTIAITIFLLIYLFSKIFIRYL
jgi:hypothetical protein